MSFCIIWCKVLIFLWHVEIVGDWIERNISCNLFNSRYKICTYWGNNTTWFSRNKCFISSTSFGDLQLEGLFEFLNGFFYLEQGEVWEQNRLIHLLNGKYLSYEREIKKMYFLKKEKMNKTCINQDWRF